MKDQCKKRSIWSNLATFKKRIDTKYGQYLVKQETQSNSNNNDKTNTNDNKK